MRRIQTLTAALCLIPLFAAPAALAETNDCSKATIAAKNAETYAQLVKAGDIAERMRPTSFFFYGGPAKILKLSKTLSENGFVMTEPTDGGQAIVGATNATMVPDTFDQLAIKVCVTADNAGVTYDGWETVVIKK